jgi:hypothetical protein
LREFGVAIEATERVGFEELPERHKTLKAELVDKQLQS